MIEQSREACDPSRLRGLLEGTLSDEEQSAMEEHLSECTLCAEQLHKHAAISTPWAEACEMLRADEFDGDASLSSVTSLSDEPLLGKKKTADVLSREIRGWLDPTDDPKMLGRFAGYEICGIIGHGGMGIVLKGFESSLNRYVAIKVLAPRLATSGAARQRFAREAQAAAAVLHENVVAIHRVAEFHGLPFLVMPYIAGISLQKRLDDEGPLSLTAILRIGAQISAGLASAHGQGLVHRDIKPANILLDPGVERVKITDFGLARTADDASVTRTGIIAGTPQYMSPEQTRGGAIDGRSDLFSLGSLVYTMSTGRPPFQADTSFGVMHRITEEEPVAMGDLNPELPAWLINVVGKLMEKQPDDRWESASEVSQLFEDCLAHVQQPNAIPLPETAANVGEDRDEHRFARSIRSRIGSRTAVAVAAAFLLFVCGGFYLYSKATGPDITGSWKGQRWQNIAIQPVPGKPNRMKGTFTETRTLSELDPHVGEMHKTFAKTKCASCHVNLPKGRFDLKWSPLEGRYNGTWNLSTSPQHGKLSLAASDGEIRGGITTSADTASGAESPRLSSLLWQSVPAPREELATVKRVVLIGTPDPSARDPEALALTHGSVIKSDAVLSEARKNEALDNLAVLKSQKSPNQWLRDHLSVAPAADAAQLEITLRGAAVLKSDLKKILDAIVSTYQSRMARVNADAASKVLASIHEARTQLTDSLFSMRKQQRILQDEEPDDGGQLEELTAKIARDQKLLDELERQAAELQSRLPAPSVFAAHRSSAPADKLLGTWQVIGGERNGDFQPIEDLMLIDFDGWMMHWDYGFCVEDRDQMLYRMIDDTHFEYVNSGASHKGHVRVASMSFVDPNTMELRLNESTRFAARLVRVDGYRLSQHYGWPEIREEEQQTPGQLVAAYSKLKVGEWYEFDFVEGKLPRSVAADKTRLGFERAQRRRIACKIRDIDETSGRATILFQSDSEQASGLPGARAYDRAATGLATKSGGGFLAWLSSSISQDSHTVELADLTRIKPLDEQDYAEPTDFEGRGPSLLEAVQMFNKESVQPRRELFEVVIPDLTTHLLRDGLRRSAASYRRVNKNQVADTLAQIASEGDLPGGDSPSMGHTLFPTGPMTSGKQAFRQIVPAMFLPDNTVSTDASLVVLRPLELIYRKNDASSVQYGDLFNELTGKIVDVPKFESVDEELSKIETTLKEMERWADAE